MGFGPVAPVGHIIATTVWAFYKAARLTPRYPKMALDPGAYESGTFEKIRQPTLLLWGSRDLYFPKSHGWRALATLPDAQLKIYNGAGHSLPIAYPVHFASDIHAFLADR
jgi:pimeloyl-ACP methyl ester carboxylesterase